MNENKIIIERRSDYNKGNKDFSKIEQNKKRDRRLETEIDKEKMSKRGIRRCNMNKYEKKGCLEKVSKNKRK